MPNTSMDLSRPLLRLEHLSIAFRRPKGQFQSILSNASLSIYAGEVAVIIGDSGSGKSTLLNFVAGFLRPPADAVGLGGWVRRQLESNDGHTLVAGKVYIGGDDVTQMEPRHRPIGLVMQRFNLYPERSVRENLRFPLEMRNAVPREHWDEEINQVSKRLGLHDLLNHRPHDLSGGQEQRVAIGKMLLCFPRIALLDEAFSNLDHELRARLRKRVIYEFLNVSRINDVQKAVLFVSHNLDDAKDADRIIVLRRNEEDAMANRASQLRVFPELGVSGTAWEQLVRSSTVEFKQSIVVLHPEEELSPNE